MTRKTWLARTLRPRRHTTHESDHHPAPEIASPGAPVETRTAGTETVATVGGPITFAPGPLHLSPGMEALATRHGLGLQLLLMRHYAGEWNLDDDPADCALLDENMAAIAPTGVVTGRVTSRHTVDGETIYLITEATGTIMLRAEEYAAWSAAPQQHQSRRECPDAVRHERSE